MIVSLSGPWQLVTLSTRSLLSAARASAMLPLPPALLPPAPAAPARPLSATTEASVLTAPSVPLSSTRAASGARCTGGSARSDPCCAVAAIPYAAVAETSEARVASSVWVTKPAFLAACRHGCLLGRARGHEDRDDDYQDPQNPHRRCIKANVRREVGTRQSTGGCRYRSSDGYILLNLDRRAGPCWRAAAQTAGARKAPGASVGSRRRAPSPERDYTDPFAGGVAGLHQTNERQVVLIKTQSILNIPRVTRTGGRS
jgi:hypothetical protein